MATVVSAAEIQAWAKAVQLQSQLQLVLHLQQDLKWEMAKLWKIDEECYELLWQSLASSVAVRPGVDGGSRCERPRVLPAELGRHMQINAGRLYTCSATRDELRLFLETRLGPRAGQEMRDAAGDPRGADSFLKGKAVGKGAECGKCFPREASCQSEPPQKAKFRPMKNGREVLD